MPWYAFALPAGRASLPRFMVCMRRAPSSFFLLPPLGGAHTRLVGAGAISPVATRQGPGLGSVVAHDSVSRPLLAHYLPAPPPKFQDTFFKKLNPKRKPS